MIYLTGDCPPGDLKLICPCCRVLLKADDVSGPNDSYKTAYLACKRSTCTHFNVKRVRYSWPLPPLYYQEANFWCQPEERPGANPAADLDATDYHKGFPPHSDGAPKTKQAVFDPDRGPILMPKGDPTMTQKTPAEMHQLSAREKMIYSLYAAKRGDTPLSVEYSVPVGHEFLTPQAGADAGMVPDSDPRLYRIDVIEKYADHIFLLEVKTRADLKAYGQLLAYTMLYAMHYQPKGPVVPLLVYEEASQILLGVCLNDEIPMFPVSIDSALETPKEEPPLP